MAAACGDLAAACACATTILNLLFGVEGASFLAAAANRDAAVRELL